MLNCIAVDDEPFALVLLEDYISKIPFLNLVAKCTDAFEATKILQEKKIDLIFIDIQMPGITGLQFIESLWVKPIFILVTAYKQYALDGYALDVIDYLVKPFSLDRFLKACNKAKGLHEMKVANKQLSNQAVQSEYFFINAEHALVKINLSDISWVEGFRDYVKIHLKNLNKTVVARNSVSGIEKLLPVSKFIRVHKSFILPISDITSVKRNSVFIEKHEFTIGDKYRNSVVQLTQRSGNTFL
jgi:two-component system LytT family response regulator